MLVVELRCQPMKLGRDRILNVDADHLEDDGGRDVERGGNAGERAHARMTGLAGLQEANAGATPANIPAERRLVDAFALAGNANELPKFPALRLVHEKRTLAFLAPCFLGY